MNHKGRAFWEKCKFSSRQLAGKEHLARSGEFALERTAPGLPLTHSFMAQKRKMFAHAMKHTWDKGASAMSGNGALASFRRLTRMAAFHPLLKFTPGRYPNSGAARDAANPVLSLIKAEFPRPRELAYDAKNIAALGVLLSRKSPSAGLGHKRRVMVQTPFLREHKTVSFGEKLAASGQFLVLFRDGMDLVSRAADYLDGDGREEAKLLPRPAAVAYAVESMRLTTRLMQIASWLLLQRAVNEGELSRAEAAAENRRIRLSGQYIVSRKDALVRLPPRLRDLIGISLRLQARIIHLDLLIYKSRDARNKESVPPSPVEAQIEQLRAALAAARVASPAM